MDQSSNGVQSSTDHFASGLKEDREYMEHQVDEEGCKRLGYVRVWMSERVVEAQQTHLEASMVTIKCVRLVWILG